MKLKTVKSHITIKLCLEHQVNWKCSCARLIGNSLCTTAISGLDTKNSRACRFSDCRLRIWRQLCYLIRTRSRGSKKNIFLQKESSCNFAPKWFFKTDLLYRTALTAISFTPFDVCYFIELRVKLNGLRQIGIKYMCARGGKGEITPRCRFFKTFPSVSEKRKKIAGQTANILRFLRFSAIFSPKWRFLPPCSVLLLIYIYFFISFPPPQWFELARVWMAVKRLIQPRSEHGPFCFKTSSVVSDGIDRKSLLPHAPTTEVYVIAAI